MAKYGMVIALILSLLIAIMIFSIGNNPLYLVYNALLGVIVFWLLNQLKLISVPINLMTILIAAIGGLLGVFIVIILAATDYI